MCIDLELIEDNIADDGDDTFIDHDSDSISDDGNDNTSDAVIETEETETEVVEQS